MSWYAWHPETLEDDPGFIRLSPPAFLIATLMTQRMLRRGRLNPDRNIYKALWGDRLLGLNFDAIYQEALTVFEVDTEGLLVIPCVIDSHRQTVTRLKNEAERARRYRQSKRENDVHHGVRHAANHGATGQDMTGQDKKNPLTPSKGAAPTEPVAWPKELQTPEFKATWDEFVQYRKERKLSAYKPTGLKRLIADMLEVGHDQAILGLRRTISKNWQGPHFEKPKQPVQVHRFGSADDLPMV